MKRSQRGAAFGAAWRKRHPRRRIPCPDALLRRLAPIADDLERSGMARWGAAMWNLQQALAYPDPDSYYAPRWLAHRGELPTG
jgi:hypothetical protein